MRSVREIIIEAAIRCNVGRRTQALPGGIEETALKLLQGIVNKYNADSLLAFSQNSFVSKNSEWIHIYDEEDYLKGENNLYFGTIDEMNAYVLSEEDVENHVFALVKDHPTVVYSATRIQLGPDEVTYTWTGHQIGDIPSVRVQNMKLYEACHHVRAYKVGKINSIFITPVTSNRFNENSQLRYVAPTDFDRYSNNSAVFTCTEKGEGEWLLHIKPVIAAQNWKLKINYNEIIRFDIDSELYIPDNYVELLIVALAHKLAIQFPRLDEAQMQRLENEVRVMVDNVRTPKAQDRVIARMNYNYGFDEGRTMTDQELLSGIWY